MLNRLFKNLLLTIYLLALPLQVLAATSTQQFTTDGSWVCPIGVTSVTVAARGAGGGGGSVSTNTDNRSAGAGAGGQYAVKVCTVVPLTSYAIDIGAIGAAGTAAGNGGTGGDTTFATNVVVAKGGVGGQSFENGYQGGTGATTNGVGDTVRKGGNGGDGGSFNGSGGGGEGACSDKDGGNGGDGSAGVAGAAGTGGDGGDGAIGKTNASGVAGGNGTAPGGGGSGAVVGTSDTNRNGGAGAIGQVDLSWTTPLISALVDNFNDNSIDAAKWTNSGWLEQNSELESSTVLDGSDHLIRGVGTYDLTDSQVTIKIVDAGDTTLASRYFSPILLSRTYGTGELQWYVHAGNIIALGMNTASYSATYNANTYRYLKIRCVGTTIYWDYSSDGITWNNATSETANIVITSLVVWIENYVEAEASTTTAKVDSFNLLPESSVLDRTKAKLLCHFNGANGATTYTSDDANARTATFAGSAQLSTAQKWGGSASLLLASATSDYLTFPDSDDWAFGTGDFEIGFRAWFVSLPAQGSYMTFLSQYQDATDNNYQYSLYQSSTTAGVFRLRLDVTSGGVRTIENVFQIVGTLSTGTFYSISYSRSGNSWYAFVNGVQAGSTITDTDNIPNLSADLKVGQRNSDEFLDGYIDELYIINGQALHTLMYEPLDVEYSLSAGGATLAAYYYRTLMQGEGY